MDNSTATSLQNTATSTGQNALNSFDPTASQNNFLNSYNSLNANQQQGSQSYQDQYAKAVAANPTVSQLYDTANQNFNVPGLMQQSTNLNNAMLQDPQQNVNAAKGFNYDANQVGQQTTQDLARLSPIAAAATNQAQQAQTLAGQQVAAGQAQNAQNLLPIQSQQQFLLQQQGNQAQAYVTANSDAFQALTAKMNAGVQLSQTEATMYNAYIQAQESLQQQQLANQGSLANTIQGQKFATIPAGSNLVNTFAQSTLNPATGTTKSF